jgi:hypothetical protein
MPPRYYAGQTDYIEQLNQQDEETAAAQQAIDDHIADTTGAHAASAISNTPAGNIAATTVQAAINELDTEKLSASATALPSSFASASINSITPTGGTLSVTGSISASTVMNAATLSVDTTIPASYNASMVGPVTVGSGVTLTVESGATLVFL